MTVWRGLFYLAPSGDVMKEGTATDAASAPQITYVQNWFEELKTRVPVPQPCQARTHLQLSIACR